MRGQVEAEALWRRSALIDLPPHSPLPGTVSIIRYSDGGSIEHVALLVDRPSFSRGPTAGHRTALASYLTPWHTNVAHVSMTKAHCLACMEIYLSDFRAVYLLAHLQLLTGQHATNSTYLTITHD